MLIPQRALLDLISRPGSLTSLSGLNVSDLAQVYVDNAFLKVLLSFISDQYWLEKQANSGAHISFDLFVEPFLGVESGPLKFLHDYLRSSSIELTKSLIPTLGQIEHRILKSIIEQGNEAQKIFAVQTLTLISELYEFENVLQKERKQQGSYLALSLYRAYDGLDEVFKLNYLADKDMKLDLTCTERLYEGAGVGVQSGYSTLLTALRYLKPELGSRFIDLGSGYGRMGIVVGLLRPDIQFTGYEYVKHRVDISQATAERFELQSHVNFHSQDLAKKDFKIPDAEIYYLYDPFSKETYQHVLEQLVTISRRMPIKIATKGNARQWLLEIAREQNWSDPLEFDDTNLCLFSSV